MSRMIRIGVMVGLMGIGVTLVAGSADAQRRRGTPLSEASLAGVTLQSSGRIRIDTEAYRVEEDGDQLVLHAKKKKKGQPETVGLSCACSGGGGGCGITRTSPQDARCTGSTCCAWITIAGGPIDTPETQIPSGR
ncbi:MAG TPA: hypothetical protein ENK18_24140 [Deltaproteobacteria bacterium]|nr:hypothetical protein [Deltaproteobacteria bacterium]